MSQTPQSIILEGFGKLPDMQFRVREDSAIEFRYCVERGNYPGFDGIWRTMTEADRRAHERLGGQVAQWLRSLELSCGHTPTPENLR